MYRDNRWQLLADYNAWMHERMRCLRRAQMTRLANRSYTPAMSLGSDVLADFGELCAAHMFNHQAHHRGQLTTLLPRE